MMDRSGQSGLPGRPAGVKDERGAEVGQSDQRQPAAVPLRISSRNRLMYRDTILNLGESSHPRGLRRKPRPVKG